MTGVLIRRPWEKDTNLKTETEMGAMRKPRAGGTTDPRDGSTQSLRESEALMTL